MDKEGIERLIYTAIGCMIEVHKQLGPGFLEKVYRRAVTVEFERQGISFEAEKEIELRYKDRSIGTHRLDLFIEGQLCGGVEDRGRTSQETLCTSPFLSEGYPETRRLVGQLRRIPTERPTRGIEHL